jgi:hypothetical protein
MQNRVGPNQMIRKIKKELKFIDEATRNAMRKAQKLKLRKLRPEEFKLK